MTVVKDNNQTQDCTGEDMCPDCELRKRIVMDLMNLIAKKEMSMEDALETMYHIAFDIGARDFAAFQIESLIEFVEGD